MVRCIKGPSRNYPAAALLLRFLTGVLLLVLWGMPALNAEETPVELAIGQSRQYTVAPYGELKASRKGIVDVRPLGHDKIQITGLREGFIVLYVLAAGAERAVLQSFHLTVVKAPESLLSATELRITELTRASGLSFKGGIISGETGDFQRFLQLKQLCQGEAECEFFALLTSEGQRKWRNHLLFLLGALNDISVGAAGVATVTLPCYGEEEKQLKTYSATFDFLSQGLVSKRCLLIQCRQQVQLESFHIAAKIVQVGDSTIAEWGAEAYALLNGILAEQTFSAPANPYVKSLGKQNHISVIGEPIIKVSAGRSSIITSGGEFVTAREISGKFISEPKELWKAYGLKLELTVFPVDAEKILVQYSLGFKQPSNSSDSHLRGSSLASSATLRLEQAEIVGSVSLQSAEKKQQSLPILEGIPLLGPIFRLVVDQDSQAQLFLWLRVNKDGGQGLPPGIAFSSP